MSADKSNSATHEPWKEPGQTSQDPSHRPPKDVVEQERKKKEAQKRKAEEPG